MISASVLHILHAKGPGGKESTFHLTMRAKTIIRTHTGYREQCLSPGYLIFFAQF